MEHQDETQAKKPQAPERGSSTRETLTDRAQLHPILQLQQSIGNRAVDRLLTGRGIMLQAKLTTAAASDPYEQEADQMAERVVSAALGTSLRRKCALSGAAGEAGERTERQQERISLPRQNQRAEDGSSVDSGEPKIVHEVLGSPGQPLDDATRNFMEPRLGADFSQVRLHTDDRAQDSAKEIGARAFTNGQHIVFGTGEYAPDSQGGKKLLAHELTHVVQQQQNAGAKVGGEITYAKNAVEPEKIARLSKPPSVQRQPAPENSASAPNAAPPASMPEPSASLSSPPKSDKPSSPVVLFEGVQLAADSEFLRHQLEQMVAVKGVEATDSFAYRFINIPLDQELKFQFLGHTAEEIGQIKTYLKEEIQHLEYDIEAFLKQFETQAIDVTKALLDNSEKEVHKELEHYGITSQNVPAGETSVEVYSMSNEGAGVGLKGSASELAKKRREVNTAGNAAAEAQKEISGASAGNPFRVGLEELERKAEQCRTDWLKKEDEYRDLCNAKQKDYPILAAYTTGPDAVLRLEAVSAMPPAGLASEIGALAQEKLANVQTVRDELGKRFSIWKEPNVLNLTKRQMDVTPAQSRAVADKAKQVQMTDEDSKKLWAAVALGLGVLAAIPTGGGSLVLAGVATTAAVLGAGLSIYGAYEHFQDIQLQSAAAGTSFDKANAISKDDPSLLWLALDVVAVITDVFAAAAAFKSLSVALQAAKAKGLEALPEVAQAARRAGLGKEAEGRLMAAAARGSGGPAEIEASIEAIRSVYKRLDPGRVDEDLAECFRIAAEKMFDSGNVHILPTKNRLAAIREVIGNDARAQKLNQGFAKGGALGYYVDLDGVDAIFLREGGTVPDLATVLAHELAHQTQAIKLDLLAQEKFESEFQAIVAEHQFTKLLAPEDLALLSPEHLKIRDAQTMEDLENITRELNKGVAWKLPRNQGAVDVLQAMADEILSMLRKR